MKSVFKCITIIMVFLCVAMMAIGCTKELTDFEKGMNDAMTSKPYEIYPLVSLIPEDNNVRFSNDYTKALFISFTFIVGGRDCYDGQEVWCVSEKELSSWIENNGSDLIRLTKLLGLREDVLISSVNCFWAEVELMFRPCYQPDVKKQLSSSDFDLSSLGNYQSWFKEKASTAFSSTSPAIWTKLGYSYDLATIGNRYGLTLFALSESSKSENVWTKNINDYLEEFDK